MRFIQIGLHAIAALSIHAPRVIGVPVDSQQNDVLIASDDALSSLQGRDGNILVAADDALKSLTGRDVDTVNITNRAASPPTYNDFVTFFKARQRKSTDLFVFWSGTGEDDANAFASANGRSTLSQILGNYWNQFKKSQQDGGYWPSDQDAIDYFWDPASQAFAEYATGDVWVYMSREAAIDQTRPDCPRCWLRIEKPRLIASKNSDKTLRVSHIYVYTYPWRSGKGPAREINTLTD